MTPLLQKLNFKNQPTLFIINRPESFNNEEELIEKVVTVKETIDDDDEIEFVLAFVKAQDEIDKLVPQIAKFIKGDALVWFAYPKLSSKILKSDINRDKGWDILGTYNFEAVRQVAVDENWSAIRFRKVDYIKK